MENIEGERKEMKEETKEEKRRKRCRKTAGSQTDEDTSNCSCHNMAASIEAINNNWMTKRKKLMIIKRKTAI